MWTKTFLLYLNIEKCKVLHFGSSKYQNNKISYYLNGIRIQPSDSEKDLGILVNYNQTGLNILLKFVLMPHIGSK